ncbi:MAG: DUF971 domain-containing protein [Candidatus Competibacteraceae bacterium]|nr:DUF971 domain-containing protein [Candidatus Competibacteraceae bacterium]
MTLHVIARIDRTAEALVIQWEDGHCSSFHYVWLRDNAPENRHPNGQRLVDTVVISLDSIPAHVVLNGTLDITWADDGITSRFDPAWLRNNAYEPDEVERRNMRPTLWQAAEIIPIIRHYGYDHLCDEDAALREMLQDVRDYGFTMLRDVPTEPGMVLEVVKLFGYVRETNYGRLFDVKVTPNPTNLAYTGLALPSHTDNPYRHPVPTLQVLHCLSNSIDGGDNTLVDGFFVAEVLRRDAPEKFDLLAKTPVKFRYLSKDTDLQHKTTIIETDARSRLKAIHFNSRSIQPFYVEPDKMKDFYSAYQAFGRLLEDGAHKITLKLDAGDVLLFDNQRILHGRSGYGGNGGERHLQGCYADKDGLLSKLAILSEQRA